MLIVNDGWLTPNFFVRPVRDYLLPIRANNAFVGGWRAPHHMAHTQIAIYISFIQFISNFVASIMQIDNTG